MKQIIEEFHVKVAQFSGNSYAIYFTNNNWITKDTINKVIDISGISDPVDVKIIPYLKDWKDLDSLIDRAREFDTYEKCIEHNEKMQQGYEITLQLRKETPIPIEKEQPKVKEILIK